MRNSDVSSMPNDRVAILVTVSNGIDDTLIINPEEIAFGKLDETGTKFYCIDNSKSYEPLDKNLYNLEPGKLYYCFDKSIVELKDIYGDNLNTNALMCCYMSNILDTLNIAIKGDKNKYNIHSIPYESIKKRTSDPIEEITRPEEKNETIVEEKLKKNDNSVKTVYSNLRAVDYTDPASVLRNINNIEFENYLKERVIGNDRVIEDTVTTILMNLSTNNPKLVNNILTVGPTGTGKTYTYELISEYLGVPFVRINASTLSTAGYKGDDTSDLLGKIWEASKHNIALANKAIVMLDEFDKLKKTDLSIKESAQNDLLTLLEGSKIDFEVNSHTGERLELDTGCMTFIGSGAFSELFSDKKVGITNPIGFLTPEQRVEFEKNKKTSKTSITKAELIKYGIKEELIGRFRKYNIYANLDAEGLKRVMKESKESILNLTKERYLNQFNVEFDCDDSFIDEIVRLALEENLGGRSLNNVTETVFGRIDRQVLMLDHSERNYFTLTRENVLDNDKKLELRKKM
ncbi:MAG: AAA family ATPase [Bacilli bacterium]|nr:AAA family ATPase [Bacilli bacterium]